MRPLALALLSLTLACSTPANTQRLPIGSRCTTNDDCGTAPFNCIDGLTHPGGYCQHDCATDGDCPADAVCASAQCRRRCSAATDCRTSEGYGCVTEPGATAMVCDFVATP